MSLTAEDREWILEQFASHAARTSADLAAMKTSLTADMADTKTSLLASVDGRIDAVEDRLKDFIRQADHDLETKIIGEFWKWSRTSDMRTKQAIESTNTLSERLLIIEDRITALERRPS